MTENASEVKLDSWAAMAAAFQSAGLAEPPIPAVLRPSLGEVERWCWSTRPISAQDMYLFRDPANEVCAGSVPDYVAVSHAGHGTNSYAINYHLVYRRLALFSQVLWGGLYTDKASSTAAVAELFGYCKALIDAAEQCAAETEAPTRLVCLYSSMRGVATVGWVKPPQDGAKVVWQLLELSPLDRNAVLPEAERLLRAGP